jgi:D-galactarolactone cycloisomerase
VVSCEVFFIEDTYVLVKLESDDGFVGWGEAMHHGQGVIVSAALRLGQWLIDMGPTSIEGAWHELFRRGYRTGSSGAQIAALSALDIALHDLLARRLGIPVWALLGGKVRSSVRVYASLLLRDLDVAEDIDRVGQCLAAGFSTVKLHTGAPWSWDDKLTNTTSLIGAVRDRWSRDELDIVVDVNNTYTVHEAIRVGHELEELGVLWFEEPIADWDLDGYRRLTDELRMPVSAGEEQFNAWQFKDLIVQGGIDIVQPNICTCGGFTGGRRVATLAEVFNRPIACHNIGPTVMTAAQIHYWASTRMATMPQEYLMEPVHFLRDKVQPLAEPLAISNGVAQVPDGPGLGVSIEEERVRRFSEVARVAV